MADDPAVRHDVGHFATFADAQAFLARHAGGEPFDYRRDDPETLRAADELGVGPAVRNAAELSRTLSPVIAASARRASGSQVLRFDRGEPGVPRSLEDRRPDATERVPEAAPLPGWTTSVIWEGYTPPPYLVKNLLAPGELTVLFGQSGHFKSALAIDLALCVAAGVGFHGLRVREEGAGVLYVAGEGHGGIRKRMRAWLIERGMNAATPQPSIYVTSRGADLIGRPDELRATAEHAAQVLGVPIELVIIDTLAANFGAGDEWHSRDMQLAIDGARYAAPEAAVLLLHHVGHADRDRERGSYALIAAADCRLQASYDEIGKTIELRWLKLKDDERPEPMVFTWRKVAIDWLDADHEELSSVVLDRLEGASATQTGPRMVGLGRNQEIALKALRTLLAKARKNLVERGDDPAKACILLDGWRHDLERRGIDRRRFHEVLNDLQGRRLVVLEGPHVRPVEGAA